MTTGKQLVNLGALTTSSLAPQSMPKADSQAASLFSTVFVHFVFIPQGMHMASQDYVNGATGGLKPGV